MPYIATKRRKSMRPVTDATANNSGDLNFQFTCLLVDYLGSQGVSYTSLNDVVGALEGAKLELQRRIIAPYENHKMWDNGDVYEGLDEIAPGVFGSE